MDAYRVAIDSRVDCIEIDVSRSSDGVLFALHDRCGSYSFLLLHFNFGLVKVCMLYYCILKHIKLCGVIC